jgi:uncharacterized protein (TIGR02145 family)
MKIFTFTKLGRALFLAAVLAALSVGTATAQQKGTFTDSRDGKKYRTVVIGGKTWMAQNLDYKTNEFWSDKEYGRLYYWETAKKSCPAGWHLPSRQEWSDLVTAAGGNMAGKALKSVKGWEKNLNGTDSYGFSALPGGEGGWEGVESRGSQGCWWTATAENELNSAYGRCITSWENNGNEMSEVVKYTDFGYSVRCIKNE